ncbi:anaphase-promoting complex subunit 4-like [Ctenocephalides felis]|uniref:anaphase-promoting complex subunit 4-like n=1 Tax=Ctenocephalides felis TaxID=7515 RepID=UPI000E6E2C66|nr:anaphase-promoting complex subunit 4-like [Ctenocephalides felis]
MSLYAMKEIEERIVVNEIDVTSWCTRLDLMAISNNKGEVALHRLNWQRVWNLPPTLEGQIVQDIVWRPDGKVIAVAYTSGEIILIDVENKELVHSFTVDGQISCLNWSQQADQTNQNDIADANKSSTETIHDHTTFLPRLPSLSTSYSNKKVEMSSDSKYLKDQTTLNILIVGLLNGLVYISVFGLFPCGIIDLKKYTKHENPVVIDAKLSESFEYMYVSYKAANKVNTLILKTSTLNIYSKELHVLALKHGHIIHLMYYMQNTINCIVEAWETALLEMDRKLEKYSACVPEGGVSADFLDLLMFGTASIELQAFLLHDLTEKGLKKMGASIEISYSTIQKLVLKNLNTVGQALVYHISDLRGMARLTYIYEALGLNENLVTQALKDIGSFLVKIGEVQQVIDHSMKNYKAFFRWLYVVIVRLMDERVPHDFAEMSQQEIKYIAEFLDNIDGYVENPNNKDETIKVRPFNLERLGQYLSDNYLTIPPVFDKNPWHEFLKQNSCLSLHSSIIEHHENHSLIQEHNQFIKSIQKVFEKPLELIGSNFINEGNINFIGLSDCESLHVDQVNIPGKGSVLLACMDKSENDDGLYIVQYDVSSKETKAVCVHFKPPSSFSDSKLPKNLPNLKPVNMQFYSSEICSVLLHQQTVKQNCIFLQLNILIYNAFDIIDACSIRLIENMLCNDFAVSSTRKVAILISQTKKKIRIYEMEVEDDEDDEDLEFSKDSDNSLINTSKVSVS